MKILKICALVLLVMFTAGTVSAAWVNPTENPPGGNPPAPINVGDVDQVKEGGLSLDGLLSSFVRTDDISVWENAYMWGELFLPGVVGIPEDLSDTETRILTTNSSFGYAMWKTAEELGLGLDIDNTNKKNNSILRWDAGLGKWSTNSSVLAFTNGAIVGGDLYVTKIGELGGNLVVNSLVQIKGGNPAQNGILVSDADGWGAWTSPKDVASIIEGYIDSGTSLTIGSENSLLRSDGDSWEPISSAKLYSNGYFESPSITSTGIVETQLLRVTLNSDENDILVSTDDDGNAGWKSLDTLPVINSLKEELEKDHHIMMCTYGVANTPTCVDVIGSNPNDTYLYPNKNPKFGVDYANNESWYDFACPARGDTEYRVISGGGWCPTHVTQGIFLGATSDTWMLRESRPSSINGFGAWRLSCEKMSFVMPILNDWKYVGVDYQRPGSAYVMCMSKEKI